MENGFKQGRNKHFSMGHAVFSGTSWQCFTMFCDIQQEMIILAGMDKCLTSPKMNSIHFEGRRSLQTTKKCLTHPTTCHVCVDTRFTWYQVPESMLHRENAFRLLFICANTVYNVIQSLKDISPIKFYCKDIHKSLKYVDELSELKKWRDSNSLSLPVDR